MDSSLLQIGTLVIAVIGAALGVVNTWRTFNNDRVRLRVSVHGGTDGLGNAVVLIEVLNLSTFPLTVTHIGFDVLGGASHMQIPRPRFLRAGIALPVCLEPRTACTAVNDVRALQIGDWATISNAYVKTACGAKAKSDGTFFAHLALSAAAGE